MGKIAVLGLLFASLVFFTVSCEDPGDLLPDDVVATVDGKEIKLDTYLSFAGGEIPDTDAAKQAKLSSMLKAMMLFEEAKKAGYLSNPEVIGRVTIDKNNKLSDMMEEKIKNSVEVALDELPEMKLQPGPSLDLYMILTNTPVAAEVSREKILDGADFEEVAKEQSIAASSVDGGHVGLVYLPTSDLSEGVKAMLNSLEIGELSPVTKTEIGYAVFKVVGRVEAIDLLERAQRQMLEDIRRERGEAKLRKLIRELRDQADIEFNEEAIESGEGGWYARVNGVPIGSKTPSGLTDEEMMHLPHAFMKGDQLRSAVNRQINKMLLGEEALREGLDMSREFLQYSWLVELETVNQVYVEKQAWDKVSVTDEEAREYYDKNPKDFDLLAKASLLRILIEDPDLAREIKEKLDEGEDFSHLAAQFSVDKSALDGGYIGEIYKGYAIEPINTVAFELNEGEHSDVIETKYGYEIIKVVWKRPAGIAPFDDIKDALKKKLYEEKKGNAVLALYDDAIKGHEVVINKRLMRKLGKTDSE